MVLGIVLHGGESLPGFFPGPLAPALDLPLLFERAVGIDRQDLGLQVGQLGQELLLDGGCVRVEGFNPGRNIFLPRSTPKEAGTLRAADLFGPALIPLGGLAFGPGNEKFLLLTRKAGHNRGEHAGNARQVVRVRGAHEYEAPFSYGVRVCWRVAMRFMRADGSGPACAATIASSSSARFLAPVTTVLTPGKLNA